MAKLEAIVRNVDDCIDRFWGKEIDKQYKDKVFSCFPKLQKMSKPRDSMWRYMTARMAACAHPDAEAFVYAFHYINPDIVIPPPLSYVDDDDVIGSALDKIGYSEDPKNRRKGLKPPLPNLKFDHVIAMFPVARCGGALALENAVLGSMHSYHYNGEWHHSALGVWQCLVRWHIACFGFDGLQSEKE